MKQVFEIVEGPYDLRNEFKLKSRKIHSVRYDIETASFVGNSDILSKKYFRKSNNEHELTLVKNQHVLHHHRTQKQLPY